jgi:homoserine kinase
MMVWGGRAAGISGSGPAIICFVPAINPTSTHRIMKTLEQRGFKSIETTVWSG